MKRLNSILLTLGLALLSYLIWKIGPHELWNQLGALGWGVVPLIMIEGLGNLAHTVGWRECIAGTSRRLPLSRLFRMALAGYAINYVTPTASLGGEITKTALLAGDSPGAQAAGSVLMDKLCLGFAHLLLVTFGSFFLLWRVKLPVQLWLAMMLSSILLTGGMVVFLLLQKRGKLGACMRWLAARKIGGRTLESAAKGVTQVDEALRVFYCDRPLGLVRSVGWHFLGHTASIFQVWLFLLMLHQTVPWAGVITAASLGLWIDLLTFAVPMNIGALEGGRIVALKAIGFQTSVGMTFGVAIRIAQMFWAVFGLLSYGLMNAEGAMQNAQCGVENRR